MNANQVQKSRDLQERIRRLEVLKGLSAFARGCLYSAEVAIGDMRWGWAENRIVAVERLTR